MARFWLSLHLHTAKRWPGSCRLGFGGEGLPRGATLRTVQNLRVAPLVACVFGDWAPDELVFAVLRGPTRLGAVLLRRRLPGVAEDQREQFGRRRFGLVR